ncbi:hypothetical protein PMG11_06413 [Penicillium brasilianum]|uniref:Uncharacterized protein n=1 Tax=Penicillium brasilianum TaxID=104259 RepID=A0A0F7TM34_PENBI|nr:hypothetical protein PMG11_06413 [Penicillium brasilianum]
MKMKTPSILRLGCVLVVALIVVAGVSAFPAPASAAGITLSKRQGQSGTTLSEDVTANGHRTRTFEWTINKVANPTTLDLVQGESGTVTYTVTLTKDDGTVHTWIDGKVCITNGGSVPTENLKSTIKVTQPPSQVVILSTPLDTTAKPVLAAGESYCYPYSIDIPSANSDTYKVNADTTITNHSGHLGEPFGPNAAATTTIPTTETLVHNTVTVSDTLGGPLGEFSDDHTVTYTHKFDCGNAGDNPNTASITYDDGTAGPSASATVTVKCTTPPPPTTQWCGIGTAFGKAVSSQTLNSLVPLPNTCKRWGWYTYTSSPVSGTLYVGAGGNDIGKAVDVGTWSATVSGQFIDVTYTLKNDSPSNVFQVTEVHVYASCTKPTTCAPGQYTYSRTGLTAQSYDTGPIDTKCNGPWYIIVHAAVSQQFPSTATCPTPVQ